MRCTHPTVGVVVLVAIDAACAFDPSVSTSAGLPLIRCVDQADCPPAFACNLGSCLPADLPVGRDATLSTTEDTTLSFAVEGDRAGLVFSVATAPRGSLVLDAAGAGTYTPPDNESGSDTFTFVVSDGVLTSLPATVVVAIAPANDEPTIVGGALVTDEDTPAGLDLGVLDRDLDPLVIAVSVPPEHGTVALAGDVAFYDPAPDFFGADAFTVDVFDGTATVQSVIPVEVAPAPDAPALAGGSLNVAEDADGVLPLVVTDVDGDTAFSYAVVRAPTRGVVTFVGDTAIYRGAANTVGADELTITATDAAGLTSAPAQFTIAVIAVDDPPIAADSEIIMAEDEADALVTVSASSPDGVQVTFTLVTSPQNGVFLPDVDFLVSGRGKYTPDPDYAGPDTIAFEARTGALSDQGSVQVTVTPVNDAPVPGPSAFTWRLVHEERFTLAATDVDGDALTYSIDSGPFHGAGTINGDELRYAPRTCATDGCEPTDIPYAGPDVVRVVVDDGNGGVVNFTIDVAVTSSRSCTAAAATGATVTGVYRLAKSSGAPYDAWCDMTLGGRGFELAARVTSFDPAFFNTGVAWVSPNLINPGVIDPNLAQSAKLQGFEAGNLTDVLLEPFGVAAPGFVPGVPIDLHDTSSFTPAQRAALGPLARGAPVQSNTAVDWRGLFPGAGPPTSCAIEAVQPTPINPPTPACRLCRAGQDASGNCSLPPDSRIGIGLATHAAGQEIQGFFFSPPVVRVWVRDDDFTDDLPYRVIGCEGVTFPGSYTIYSPFDGAPVAVTCP